MVSDSSECPKFVTERRAAGFLYPEPFCVGPEGGPRVELSKSSPSFNHHLPVLFCLHISENLSLMADENHQFSYESGSLVI